MKTNSRGVTLLELVVVIAIVAILASGGPLVLQAADQPSADLGIQTYAGLAITGTVSTVYSIANPSFFNGLREYRGTNVGYPYPGGIAVDPTGPDLDTARMVRGGGALSPPGVCRSAARGIGSVADVDDGFRVVLTISSSE